MRQWCFKKMRFVLLICFSLLPQWVFAADISQLDDAASGLESILTGTFGKTIAGIAVVVVGFMWMSGRLAMMRVIQIAVGIGIVAGASSLVSTFWS